VEVLSPPAGSFSPILFLPEEDFFVYIKTLARVFTWQATQVDAVLQFLNLAILF